MRVALRRRGYHHPCQGSIHLCLSIISSISGKPISKHLGKPIFKHLAQLVSSTARLHSTECSNFSSLENIYPRLRRTWAAELLLHRNFHGLVMHKYHLDSCQLLPLALPPIPHEKGSHNQAVPCNHQVMSHRFKYTGSQVRCLDQT